MGIKQAGFINPYLDRVFFKQKNMSIESYNSSCRIKFKFLSRRFMRTRAGSRNFSDLSQSHKTIGNLLIEAQIFSNAERQKSNAARIIIDRSSFTLRRCFDISDCVT